MVDKIASTQSRPAFSFGRFALSVQRKAYSIHGQRLHQQAIAEAFIAEDLMWIIGCHGTNL